MNKYDLVQDGEIISKRVRFNVETTQDGHCEVHPDVTLLTHEERCECGIYESFDPATIYNGRAQKLGPKTSVIDHAACTVTYTTPVINLSLDECKGQLYKVVSYRYDAAFASGLDISAIKQGHDDSIAALTDWASAASYDPTNGWPVITM